MLSSILSELKGNSALSGIQNRFKNFGSNLNSSGMLTPDYTSAFDSMGNAIKVQAPIYGAGMYALSKYLPQSISLATNPAGYEQNIESGYTASPYAEYQENKLSQYSNASAAQAGDLGSPNQQYDLAKEEQGLVSKDQQQYYDNVTGLLKEGMGGEETVAGMGQGAANQISTAYNVIAALQAAQANEGESALGGLLGTGASLIGSLAKAGIFSSAASGAGAAAALAA